MRKYHSCQMNSFEITPAQVWGFYGYSSLFNQGDYDMRTT